MKTDSRNAAVPSWLAVLVAASLGYGSGSSGGDTSSGIGPGGGTFTAGGGISVVVPPGAVSGTVQLTAAATQDPAPAIPGYTTLSNLYRLGPDGTTFDPPRVTLVLPTPAGAPPCSTILSTKLGDPSSCEDVQGEERAP
jgi:hypothetical protein